jgi:hypothetical protein
VLEIKIAELKKELLEFATLVEQIPAFSCQLSTRIHAKSRCNHQ